MIRKILAAPMILFLWLREKIYRWLSVITAAFCCGIDGMMHVLNIPHAEGWWLPVVGGSAFVGAGAKWLRKSPKKSASACCDEHSGQ